MRRISDIENRLSKLGNLKTGEPLKKYTSFRTGGPADFMIWPKDKNSLREIISISADNSVELTVLGGCTNLLVSDAGISGIVVMMNSLYSGANIRMTETGAIYADAGTEKKDFLNFCVDRGFRGMQFLAGIYGCIGGGIAMNAGTVDGEFADILKEIEFLDNNGEIITKPVSGDMFGYRKILLPDCRVILGGYFKLDKTDNIGNVKKMVDEILNERKKKHPLEYPSAGSVFKNPNGYSSWKLIDDSGLKGKRVGGACVSDLHTNFIINLGEATSENILNLINEIKEKILQKYNIQMETEIKMIGRF